MPLARGGLYFCRGMTWSEINWAAIWNWDQASVATLVIWDRLVSHLYSSGTISLGPSPQLRSS